MPKFIRGRSFFKGAIGLFGPSGELVDQDELSQEVLYRPNWKIITIEKLPEGVNGCGSANGCWLIDGETAVEAEADGNQTLNIWTMPAKTWIHGGFVKPTSLWTGADTISAFVGNGADGSWYLGGSGYNMKGTPGNTTLGRMTANSGTNTFAATVLRLSIITTPQNVSNIVAGAAAQVGVCYSIIP